MQDIYNRIFKKAEEKKYPYFTYGLFQLIAWPIYYIIWNFVSTQPYENILIRALIAFFGTPLIFHKFWTEKYVKFLPLYWYFVCCYSLPFFFTFMLLKNNFSYTWSLNSLTGVILCILFLDIQSLLILVPLGTFAGWLAYDLTTPQPYYDLEAIKTVCITYGSAFIFGGLFAQRSRNIAQEKLNTMKVLAGSIAHELRTPLSALMMDVQYLAKYFPYYQDAYAQAREAKLPIHKMSREDEADLAAIPKELQSISQNANTMITMLLTNLNEGTTDRRIEACSMKLCVEEALKTYPFSPNEKRIVHWQGKDGEPRTTADFTFLGHKELTKHVFYNLIKNALYAIASSGKGEIFIAIDRARDNDKKSESMNKLIFKDTGSGISPDILRHIFDRFYTKTEHGAGIGLAFCQSVIQSFGGDIVCSSQQGEHTTFTIFLPVIKECSTA
jgi:signal transduction histidine kinase